MLKTETIFSPPVLLLVGLLLVFISVLIFKFFRNKKEKISYQLTIIGFLILLLFFPLPKNFFSANLNIQTRLVPQPKISQVASPAKKQAVKITSQNLKAGQGITISDNIISLSKRNTQGTFGSANKIPQITVDNQGRIEKVVEKDIEKITEAEVDDYVSNNGYLTEEEDGDSNNELNLSFNLSGDNLNITDNGGTLSVNLSKYIDNTESINELGDVDTSTNPPVSGQILSWNGNNWVPASTTSLETVTNIANQVVGHKIADYTNENGVVQDINETITSLALNGNSLDYTDEDGTTTNIDLSGYLDNTDNQTLSFNNITNILSLTSGGNVDLSSLNDEYSAGNGLSLTGTTFSVNSPTCAGTDKLQWNGTSFVCSSDVDTTYSAGTGLSLTGTTFSLNAGIDLLTDVDTTTTTPTNGQTLKWDGSNWVPADDNDTTYSAGTGLNLSGTTFSLNAGIDLLTDVDTSTTPPGNGDILTWDGSNWVTTSSTAYTDNIYTADGTLTGDRTVSLGGNDLYFTGSGNIGIGTSSPINKLQVNGNVRATRFVSSDGTAGSPAFRFSSDADTGIFRAGANQLAFTTGGNERVRIDDNGRVGIRTSSPDSQLQVNGNVHINRDLLVEDSEIIYTDHDYVDSGLNGETLNWNLLQTQKTDNPNDADFATITSGTGFKQIFPITRWKIGDEATNGQHYGYVGYFPDSMAHDGAFRVNTAGHDETDLILGVGTKDIIHIDNHSFYVGLGTDSPDQLLDIDGTMRLRGAFYDRNNQPGTAGQILSSTATGTDWVDASSVALGSIDQHSDVDTTTTAPTNGQTLKWDGSNWVPADDNDTTYTASGTLLNLSGNTFSVNEGTLTDTRLCTYEAGTGLVCNTDPNTVGSTTFIGLTDTPNNYGTNGYLVQTDGSNALSYIDPTSLALGSIDNHSDVDTTTTAPANGQTLKWDGSNWVPADDNDTTYSAGTGLNLSGTTFNLADTAVTAGSYGDATHSSTFTVDQQGRLTAAGQTLITPDWTSIQNRPSGLDDGDDDTTYSAGNGLNLSAGNEFSINSPTCAGTDKLQWNGTSFVCSADVDTTYSAGTGLNLSGTTFSLNAGIDLLTDVDTSTTPPGNGDILTWDGSNWVTTSSTAYTDNIYTADGTLTGDRTVSLGGNDLAFDSDKLFINGTNGNVGIGTNNPLTRLDIAHNIVFDRGNNNVTAGSDIWFAAQGLLSADSNMLFNIDADNNSTSEYFRWSTNSDSSTGALELMRLTEDEGLDVANHAAVGANAGIVNNQTLRVTENFNIDSNSVQIQASGTITSPTLTADRISYGGYFYLINNKTEDIANGYDSDGTAVFGFTQTNGTHTFRYNRGGLFEARNSSNATSDLGNLYGMVGVARQYASDDSADIATIIGSYGQSIGYSGAGSTAGDINIAYGSYANVYPYKSDINTAYGVYGYVSTNNSYDGDIGVAYGVRGQVRVDSDDGGDITNGYGGYFSTTKRTGANNMTNATALYALVAAADTAYAGRFYANSSDATTNYGLYINVANASTNNYGIYTERGDWILDEDGDGIAGGTGPGGDLILGEDQDFALYHNGTNSYIQNNTGDLIINGNSNNYNLIINNFDLIGVGTLSPSYDIDVDRTGSNPNRSARIRLRGSSSGYTNAALILQATSGTNYRGTGIFMHDEGGDNEWFAGRPYADSDKYIIARLDSVANVDESVAQTSNALLTVQNDGSVGIGTSSPTDTLHIAGSLRVEGALKDNNNSAGTIGQVLTATATGFEWQNPTSCVMGGAKIQGNGTVTNSYGIISSVNRTNTGRYTINFSQSVNTDDYYVHLSKEESTSTRDDVNIDISAYNTNNVQVIIHEGDNGTAANVYRDRAFSITIFDANCTALSAVTSSDRRLKRNIENIEPETALDKVLQLQGVSYKWDTIHHPFRRGMDNKPEIGFIAQDVQKILPEVVNVEKDGYLSLEYGKIMAVTVEALKDIWNNVQDNQDELDKIKDIVQEAEEERKHLSDNINSLADLNTQMTATLENHEERIADLESKVNALEEMIDSQNISLIDQEDGTVKQAIKDWAQHIAVIEKQGKEITFDLDGNLKVKNLETEALTTAKFTVFNQDVEKRIIGEAIIPAGETKIRINNKAVNEDSYILLTPRQPITVALGKIKKGEYFEIKISEALDKDLKVQWFIINEK